MSTHVCDSEDDVVIKMIESSLSVIDDDADGKLSMAEIKDWWHDNKIIIAYVIALCMALIAWACLAANRCAKRAALGQQHIETLNMRRERSYPEPRQRERFDQVAAVLDGALRPTAAEELATQGDATSAGPLSAGATPSLPPPPITTPHQPAPDPSSPAAASSPAVTPLVISSVECRICMDRPKAVRYRPCGHCLCCVSCTIELLRKGDASRFKCPICRAHVDTIEWREEWRTHDPLNEEGTAVPPPASRMPTDPQPRLPDALSGPCEAFLRAVAAWQSDATRADAEFAQAVLDNRAPPPDEPMYRSRPAQPLRAPDGPHIVVIDCCARELHAGVGGEQRTAPSCVFSTGVGYLRALRYRVHNSYGGMFGPQHGIPGHQISTAPAFADDIDPHRHTVRHLFNEHGRFIGEREHLERIWVRALQQLQLSEQVNQCRVILSEPPGPILASERDERERKVQIMFEDVGVRSLLLVSHAALVLLGSGVVLGESVVSGVVLHSGDGLAYASIVYEGDALRHTCRPIDAEQHQRLRGTASVWSGTVLTNAISDAISRVRDIDVTQALLRNLVVVLSGDQLTNEDRLALQTWSQTFVEQKLSGAGDTPTWLRPRVLLPVRQRGCLAWVGGSLLATVSAYADASAEDIVQWNGAQGSPLYGSASPFITKAEYDEYGRSVHSKCF